MGQSQDRRSIEGIVTATPTPVRQDGTIDRDAAAQVVELVVAGGSSAIAPIGGTGEYTALTPRQRLEMLDVTIEAVAGRLPVIAGILSPGLGETLQAVRDYTAAGADMLMIVTPYYVRPTGEGVVDYYKAVSDATDLPLMLYEIPYRTGVQLAAETVLRVSEASRVIAMKSCSNDLVYQTKLFELVGDRITILTGEENVFPSHVALGAKGGFLASSLFFPKMWQLLLQLAEAGRRAEASALHRRMMPFVSMLYREHNPAPIRAALDILGMPHGNCLPPLRPASDETSAILRAQLPEAMKLEAEATAALAALKSKNNNFQQGNME